MEVRGKRSRGLLAEDGSIHDLSGVVADIDGQTLSEESLRRLREVDAAAQPKVTGEPRLGACVAGVGNTE